MNPFEDVNRRFASRLREEVAAWEQDGAISPEQARAILARYPEDSNYEAARRRQSLVVGFSILGASL